MPENANNVKIFSFKWEQIDTFIYVTFIILFTTLLRVVQKNVKIFRNNVPESWWIAMLIMNLDSNNKENKLLNSCIP